MRPRSWRSSEYIVIASTRTTYLDHPGDHPVVPDDTAEDIRLKRADPIVDSLGRLLVFERRKQAFAAHLPHTPRCDEFEASILARRLG